MPSTSSNVIDASEVAKTYANGTVALAPTSLTIRSGEFVTLLGPSGCGKTTLLNVLAGLLDPSSGAVRWWDASMPGPRGRLAYVFQSPTLMPWSRVAANVRLPLDLAHVPRAEADRRVGNALVLVGLRDFADHYPRELSGGMQMRASIARALVVEPDLLLMDEPFGALDEFSRHRLDGELASLALERSLTVVFVTHSIAEAVFLSTRVVVMAARPGRVVADVPIEAPKPRDAAFRVSNAFVEQCARLSALIGEAGTALADAG